MSDETQPDTAGWRELIERVEALPCDSADLIRKAATLILGSVPDQMNRMLAADAYESAATMLVPPGWEWTIESGGHVEMTASRLRGPNVEGNAATPALAIVAASLRAKASNASTDPRP
ncbi:hypothetical protein [Sphingopyxis sp. PET50]|uniref:hypothetical protein n=1 Tax=Sphingopyxis sp. PET50 TaxID=2976533 RepID=UPI0021AE43FC|nr:hypothetical protein [Sphingopyxis sp. PET50]